MDESTRDLLAALIIGAIFVGGLAVAGWTAVKGEWGIALVMLLILGSVKISIG